MGTTLSSQSTVVQAPESSISLTSSKPISVRHASQVHSQPTLQKAVRFAHLATLVTERQTRRRPQSSRTTEASVAGRVTTALQARTSQKSALQALSTLTRAWRKSLIASSAHQAHSRMSGAAQAAKYAASLLTQEKARPSVSVLELIVPTLLRTHLADARATLTTLMRMSSPKVTSVTSQTASHSSMITARSMAMVRVLGSLMVLVLPKMNASRHALVSQVLAPRSSVSALAPMLSTSTTFATRIAESTRR